MTGKQVNKAATKLRDCILECVDRSDKIHANDRIAVLGLLAGKLREETDKLREATMGYSRELDEECAGE